jgi:hypothetical protein
MKSIALDIKSTKALVKGVITEWYAFFVTLTFYHELPEYMRLYIEIFIPR